MQITYPEKKTLLMFLMNKLPFSEEQLTKEAENRGMTLVYQMMGLLIS
jgi:hypothetical protein